MLKNGLLTLLFAFIPGAGQMYQGYMKRGLSLMLMCCVIGVLAMLFAPIALFLMLVFMYSFFDTLNLRAQIALGNAPADDYLVHLDPKDKRLARLLLDSHKLVGWALIAFGSLIAYQNLIMNTLGDLVYRWGHSSPVFRALYLVMDSLPDVVVCVVHRLRRLAGERPPSGQKAGLLQGAARGCRFLRVSRRRGRAAGERSSALRPGGERKRGDGR